ncbi:hypothetical protein [Pseudonocardia sp. T1-2H]|uniref:hypothetical protein n=1 Tax=Pseudonocardia sp. T1-2H TaxID=3128899 RepID=UPI0031015CBE
MSAPTADTAALIAAFRFAVDFAVAAIEENDDEAAELAAKDRHRIAYALTEHGQGWVSKLLAAEGRARVAIATTPAADRARYATAQAARTEAVDAVLARCA